MPCVIKCKEVSSFVFQSF